MENMAGMMSINTHLKSVLDFIAVFDLAFLFFVGIWHELQNGSWSTLSSICCQNISVYPYSSDLVDLCPNLWCNNSRDTFFLGIFFCDFDFSFIFTKNECFFVSCAVMSTRSVCYFWIRPRKIIYEKSRYVPNSST